MSSQQQNPESKSDYETNEMIIEQQNKILNEIAQSQPLIGHLVNPATIIPEYEHSDSLGFVPGLRYLSLKYLMRKIRGDGNCFYRSFLYSYLERLISNYHTLENASLKLKAENEQLRMINTLKKCKEHLLELGYSEIAFETFYDITMELLLGVFTQSRNSLFVMFSEGGHSEYYIWFMRLLTAVAMKRQCERFLPYVFDEYTPDIETYISREVEPMGRECEQVQILALAEYVGVVVTIEYLDGRLFDEAKGLSTIVCPDMYPKESYGVTLLYRPGHYDILYPIS